MTSSFFRPPVIVSSFGLPPLPLWWRHLFMTLHLLHRPFYWLFGSANIFCDVLDFLWGIMLKYLPQVDNKIMSNVKYTPVKDGKSSLYVTYLCYFRLSDMSSPPPPCHLSSVIKVSSFGVPPPPPPISDDVINLQPLRWHYFSWPILMRGFNWACMPIFGYSLID